MELIFSGYYLIVPDGSRNPSVYCSFFEYGVNVFTLSNTPPQFNPMRKKMLPQASFSCFMGLFFIYIEKRQD